MRICIIIDTWKPQTNGVVTTFVMLKKELEKQGHDVTIVHPFLFRMKVRCPSDHELLFALPLPREFSKYLRDKHFDAIHIATEGTLGLLGRRWCIKNKIPFTSSYLTQFPEYIKKRFRIPSRMIYPFIRRFHSKAVRTLVPTESIKALLEKKKFRNISVWPGGVDTDQFQPLERRDLGKRPVWLYVGRIAPEKNIKAFLSLELPGTKIVVGDGMLRASFQKKLPDIHFMGRKEGMELVSLFGSSDVLVFPSRTDTFGLVIIEAMACGTPVAAYPVEGPKDLIREGVSGALDEDLKAACLRAIVVDRKKCREYAKQFSWELSAKQFLQLM